MDYLFVSCILGKWKKCWGCSINMLLTRYSLTVSLDGISGKRSAAGWNLFFPMKHGLDRHGYKVIFYLMNREEGNH